MSERKKRERTSERERLTERERKREQERRKTKKQIQLKKLAHQQEPKQNSPELRVTSTTKKDGKS